MLQIFQRIISPPISRFWFSIFVIETLELGWQCSQYLELNPTCDCESKFNASARKEKYVLNIPIIHFDVLKIGSQFENGRESIVAMINLILDNTTWDTPFPWMTVWSICEAAFSQGPTMYFLHYSVILTDLDSYNNISRKGIMWGR